MNLSHWYGATVVSFTLLTTFVQLFNLTDFPFIGENVSCN